MEYYIILKICKKLLIKYIKLHTKNTEIKIMLYAKNSYKKFLLNDTDYRYEAQKGCPVVHTVSDKDINDLIKNKFKIIEISQDFIFPYQN